MRLYSTSFVYDRFPTCFVQLGSQVYTGGSVGIRVNDDIGHNFQMLKGLRKGDPISYCI
jgi:hypothetical protein